MSTDSNTTSAAATDPRVLLVTPGWPADAVPNGIVTYVSNLRRILASRSKRPGVLSLKPAVAGRDEDVWSVPDLAGSNRPGRRLSRKLAQLFGHHPLPGVEIGRAARAVERRMPYDLLEVEESFGFPLGIRRAVKVPVIVRLHGPWFLTGAALRVPQDHAFREKVRLEGQAIMEADAISACSPQVLKQVREYYGVALEGARVIPNPGPDVPEDAVWSLERSDPNHLLFVGRFDSFKGGDTVLAAMAAVLRHRPQLRFTFVGPDRGLKDEDGRMWSAPEFLRHVAPEAQVRDRITLTGPLPRSEVERLRPTARVTMITSRYENHSLAAAEIMAQGCPGVFSTIAALPGVMRDGENGLLFEPGDADGLRQCVERLLDDPQMCARIGAAARADYHDQLGPEAIATQTLALYRETAARGRHA